MVRAVTYLTSLDMLTTKAKGAQTELECITYLHGLGYNISIPWGDNARYDFILDVKHKLYKIQCKTSLKKEEGIYKFQCKSTRINSQGNYITFYTKDDIDFFCTFIENKCYLIPIEETSRREKVMRFIPPKNNQHKKVTFANEYLADTQIQKLIEE